MYKLVFLLMGAVMSASVFAAPAYKVPSCVPKAVRPFLTTEARAAVDATKWVPMQVAPSRWASANGQSVYWTCKKKEGKTYQYRIVLYYATANAWSSTVNMTTVMQELGGNFDAFMQRLTGPACGDTDAIAKAGDAQIGPLCAETHAEALKLLPTTTK